MRRLFLFMMVSLDGYFEGPDHDLSWHNADNDEFARFVAECNANTDAILMGRRTYELMEGFWPTADAHAADPWTASFMTNTRKYVATDSPLTPCWENVTVLDGDVPAAVRALKDAPGGDIALFGSNMLLVSLVAEGLVDEFRLMMNPVALGAGTTLFRGLRERTAFQLTGTRAFASGNVLLTYERG